MNRQDEGPNIDAMLRHLVSGRDVCDFPGTATEKVALVRTARARGLIAWRKARARYELTPIGWIRLAPRPRFGVASLILSTAVGAIVGGAALLAFTWLPADAPPRIASRQPLQASHSAEPVARTSRPQQVVLPTVEAEADRTETPAFEPPTLVVSAPDPPSAEPALTGTKEVTARKPRRKTAHRRRKEQGAAWAYVRSWQGQQFRYAGYGERGAWLGYR
jgi:hypothetical protein